MSRKAIVTTLAIYFVVALAFGIFQTFAPASAFDLRPEIWIGGAIGKAVGVFVIGGILPLIFWAFWRFHRDGAFFPVVLWGLLGLVVMGLSGAATMYDEPDAMANVSDNIASLFDSSYGAVVRAMNRSCVATSRANQGNIKNEQIHAYCDCYADAMGKALTADDIGGVVRNGNKPTAAVIEKAKRIGPMCSRLALGR